MIIDQPYYVYVISLLIGVLYAILLYLLGKRQPYSAKWRVLLFTLRAIGVASIVFLLFEPIAKHTAYEQQRPHVVLAQDVSLSVAESADSSFSMTPLQQTLAEKCNITTLSFGNNEYTDIGAAIETASGDNVSAIVLATDGLHNYGVDPVVKVARLPIPIYCISLGDTIAKRDLRIESIRSNRVAKKGNQFTVEVAIGADFMKGEQAHIEVRTRTGKVVSRHQEAIDDDFFVSTIELSVMAEEAGVQRYEVAIQPARGESVVENNVGAFYVDVVESKGKVVICANAPHPDIGALVQSFSQMPQFETEVVWASELDESVRILEGTDILVLHNLPSSTHPADYSQDYPCLYVIGAQTDLHRFNALRTGITIKSTVSRINEVMAVANNGFSLFSVREPMAFESFPPLHALFGQAEFSDDIQSLFTARIGSINTSLPLVAATTTGRRRVFVWGEGLWRWRMGDYMRSESHELFDNFVAQITTFLTLSSPQNRLHVQADKVYRQGESVGINAQLYNESFEPYNDPELQLILTRLTDDEQRGEEGTYQFRQSGTGYTLTLPPLEAGVYRYKAEGNGHTDGGTFVVERFNLEHGSLSTNSHLLSALATSTGGAVYTTHQVDQLQRQLEKLKPTIVEQTTYSDLLHLPWVLVIILLLLALEWGVRKYNNQV